MRAADDDTCKTSGAYDQSGELHFCSRLRCEGTQSFDGSDRYALFEEFSESGLCRLGLVPPHEIDLFGIWKEVHPFTVSFLLFYKLSNVIILVFSAFMCSHFSQFNILCLFFMNENLNI